jgi:hypothetical protein
MTSEMCIVEPREPEKGRPYCIAILIATNMFLWLWQFILRQTDLVYSQLSDACS